MDDAARLTFPESFEQLILTNGICCSFLPPFDLVDPDLDPVDLVDPVRGFVLLVLGAARVGDPPWDLREEFLEDRDDLPDPLRVKGKVPDIPSG